MSMSMVKKVCKYKRVCMCMCSSLEILFCFVFVFLLSFWLFYGVHLLEDQTKIKYKDIVQFALSLVDALLFVHYLAVLLLELRHRSTQFCVKVQCTALNNTVFLLTGCPLA